MKKDNKVVEYVKTHKKEIALTTIAAVGGVAVGCLIGNQNVCGISIKKNELTTLAKEFFADMADKGVKDGYCSNGSNGNGYMLSELGKFGEDVMNGLHVEDRLINGVVGLYKL